MVTISKTKKIIVNTKIDLIVLFHLHKLVFYDNLIFKYICICIVLDLLIDI